jgi:hypothetical protein
LKNKVSKIAEGSYGVVFQKHDIRNMRCPKGQRAFFENPNDFLKIKA